MIESILENVIFLDIKFKNIESNSKKFMEVGAIKIKDGYKYYFHKEVEYEKYSSQLFYGMESYGIKFSTFIEDFPIICHNAYKVEKILSCFRNVLLDSKELSIILEPSLKKLDLKYIVSHITTLKIKTLDDSIVDVENTLYLVNALLVRLWSRGMDYYNIIGEFEEGEKWRWCSYLIPMEKNLDIHKDYILIGDIYLEEKTEGLMPIKELNLYEGLFKEEDMWKAKGKNFHYAFREGQYIMAKNIREVLEKKSILSIEAPTGIGKSIAYLLNAAIFTHFNRKEKVIISTNTKNLQRQLMDKDLPYLLRVLGLENSIKYSEIKGKGNYICLNRLKSYIEEEKDNFNLEDKLVILYIKRFSEGYVGDNEDINLWIRDRFKSFNHHLSKVLCESDLCRPCSCNYGNKEQCFYVKKLEDMKEANIIIVNHSLLTLWPYGKDVELKYVILDEAHNMIEHCYKAYSNEVNSRELLKWLKELYDFKKEIGQLKFFFRKFGKYLGGMGKLEDLKSTIQEIGLRVNLLKESFKEVLNESNYNSYKINYPKNSEEKGEAWLRINSVYEELEESLIYLSTELENLVKTVIEEDEDLKEQVLILTLNSHISKLRVSARVIEDILNQEQEDCCYFLEVDKEYEYWCIKVIDLNVASKFKEEFLSKMESCIFTSATLRVRESFNYFKNALGISLLRDEKKLKELTIKPVFDVKNRVKVCVPIDLPQYNYRSDKAFIDGINTFLVKLVESFKGNILILFTSLERKNKVMDIIVPKLRELEIEVHDSNKGIEEMKDLRKRTVLIGTKGFFEGVDIPGEGLTCVVLDKIPNLSPSDPLVKSRIEKYERDTGIKKNFIAYNQINYPETSIKLKQILGRLLRTKYDYGYLFVLEGLNDRNKNTNLFIRDLGIDSIEKNYTDELLESMNKDFSSWKKTNIENIKNEIKEMNFIEKEITIEKLLEEEMKKRNLKSGSK